MEDLKNKILNLFDQEKEVTIYTPNEQLNTHFEVFIEDDMNTYYDKNKLMEELYLYNDNILRHTIERLQNERNYKNI